MVRAVHDAFPTQVIRSSLRHVSCYHNPDSGRSVPLSPRLRVGNSDVGRLGGIAPCIQKGVQSAGRAGIAIKAHTR